MNPAQKFEHHGWHVEVFEQDGTIYGHVLPVSDVREHDESPECWCQPFFEENCWVHNSADQRELYEEGVRKPN